MKNLTLTKKELQTSVDETLIPYKNLIEILRKEEYSHFKSVRHFPLSKIFTEAKLPLDYGLRAALLLALKKINFLECEGNMSGMKYRLKEQQIHKDSFLLATELKNLTASLLNKNKLKRKYTRHAKLNNIDEKNLSSSPVSVKKTYALGENVFLMKDDQIVPAKIIALKYEILSQVSEDYPRIQLPPVVNSDKTLASVLIDQTTVYTTSTANLFPQIDLLLKSLQLKYEKTLPLSLK